jgi:hypothetical protein
VQKTIKAAMEPRKDLKCRQTWDSQEKGHSGAQNGAARYVEKVSAIVWIGASGKQLLFCPRSCQAGERAVSGEPRLRTETPTQKKVESGAVQGETTLRGWIQPCLKPSIPGTFRSLEPVKVLFGLSRFQGSFSQAE